MSVFTNPASSSKEDAKAYTHALFELLGGLEPLEVLRLTGPALHRHIDGLSDAQVASPEAPGKWSVRQVVAHLADSELVTGFRLRMILSQDRPPLIGYDQDLWADRLHYAQADIQEALHRFGVLRRGNLWLLERATPEDRKRVGVHAERGEESVEHISRLVAGHDLLHLRQIERIQAAIA